MTPGIKCSLGGKITPDESYFSADCFSILILIIYFISVPEAGEPGGGLSEMKSHDKAGPWVKRGINKLAVEEY